MTPAEREPELDDARTPGAVPREVLDPAETLASLEALEHDDVLDELRDVESEVAHQLEAERETAVERRVEPEREGTSGASRRRWASQAPARAPWRTIGVQSLTAAVALCGLVGLGVVSGHLLLIPPMAAIMALLLGAPHLPLAQPRNVIGGQLISSVVGVAIGLLSHSVWAAALSGAVALGLMMITRTSHSPAAATAVIGALTTQGQIGFIVCTALASMILVVVGIVHAKLTRTRYPVYWW